MQVYSSPTSAEIEAVLDAEVMSRLLADIDESHCGLLPESQFPPMVRVQQTRDHIMAQSLLLDEGKNHGLAVLITKLTTPAGPWCAKLPDSPAPGAGMVRYPFAGIS